MFSCNANQLRIVVLLLNRARRVVEDSIGVRFTQCALQQWLFRDFGPRQEGGRKICLFFGDEIIDWRLLKEKLLLIFLTLAGKVTS
jgi:hypothetical protein